MMNDVVSTIGTYSKEYLLEALEQFEDEYLTFGYYLVTDPDNGMSNCLIVTDGNQNVGIAPRVSPICIYK